MAEGGRIQVLMVEDNAMVARFLRELLEMEAGDRMQFSHAARVGEVEQRVAAQGFDVILLDLSLPDSFGLATLAKVRALAPQTPILVLSASDDHAVARQAVEEGAKAYLVKGQADAGEILQAIEQAVAH